MDGLRNQRILVTRSPDDQEAAAEAIRALEGIPIACPTIRFLWPNDTAALDRGIRDLEVFDWLFFTSPNTVRFFLDRFYHLRGSQSALESLKKAAIGPSTQERLQNHGLQAEFVAVTSTGDAFVDEFALNYPVSGKSFLLPMSSIARNTVPETLRLFGGRVKQVTAYRNEPVTELPPEVATQLQEQTIDWILFTSSSTADNFMACLQKTGLPLTA
ncbi:hypothetical protein GF373_10835, partial [bacterium]|nr:hypothetical protein [bacterium]